MDAKFFTEVNAPKNLNDIPVSNRFAEILRQTDKKDWEDTFTFIRLNLQSRISGTDTIESVNQLQGKIELANELKAFFQSILIAK